MPVFYDQLNRAVELPHAPQRIISIVPSQTELLFHLDVTENIIAVTDYCTRPAEFVKKSVKIGGTKKLNIPLIRSLQPDLVIANKEENDRSQVQELMSLCPVWISDIDDLPAAISMITSIGEMIGRKTEADSLTHAIIHRFGTIKKLVENRSAAYLIWRKPWMVAGNSTFINSMLHLCGFTNAFDMGRYPVVDEAGIKSANPDVVLLSSEPYPFSQKHQEEFTKMLPNAKILLVDGEMFSWYGSRLLHAPAYFNELIKLVPPM